MVDWFYIGYCTVMAMFAVAAAYAAVVGLRALRRLPRSLMVGFVTAAIVATLTAQKTNNVPPNMNQPQMMQGGGSFQTGFTGLTGLVGIGNLISLVNPAQTTIDDIMRGWRVESVTTNAAVSYAMPTNAALVGNWHIHGAASSFGNNVVDFGVLRTSGTLVPTNWSFPLGTNDANRLTVSLPLELTFERVQMRGGSDSYVAHTSPIDVGPRILNIAGGCCSCVTNEIGFSWGCSLQCLCGGSEHSLSGAAKWEGYSYPFSWRGRCRCYYEDQASIDEIESRGVSLEILDASGNAIEWKYPVIVGESVIVKATVGGSEMTVSDFVGLFGGRIRLKSYYVDFDGAHDIAGAAIPISATTTTSQGQNVFRVSVAAAWLQSNGIIRNADDEIVAKTSVDMANGPDAGSDRIDSDCFDENTTGRLYGRARGRWGGNADAQIPEGEFNLKTVQAAGTGCLMASCGASCSTKKQCQQQADVFYYSGHGEHDTGRLYGVAVPADVTNHWRDVETVIFAGCSVLDIGDKGNHYSNPASHSASPGLKWATLSGASALLGYCWKAPLDNQGGVQIINSWCANRSSLGDVAAWMRANDNMNGRNACAIRLLQGGKIEYRYFRRDGRGWNLRSKYLEIVEEINL